MYTKEGTYFVTSLGILTMYLLEFTPLFNLPKLVNVFNIFFIKCLLGFSVTYAYLCYAQASRYIAAYYNYKKGI